MEEVKRAVLDAWVLTEGHFIFADGGHGIFKLEMDRLWDHEQHLTTVLQHLAHAEGLPSAEVMMGIPNGGQRLAEVLCERGLVQIPFARLERIPGGAKQDFRFCSDADEQMAKNATSVRIHEDVVTTGSSIAGAVRLLDTSRQDIHALSIWRRGTLKPEYQKGVTHHFLVEEHLPTYAVSDCPVCAAEASLGSAAE